MMSTMIMTVMMVDTGNSDVDDDNDGGDGGHR